MIFLLHGIGANGLSLRPLEKYLNLKEINNTCVLDYPIDVLTFDTCLDFVDKEMQKYANKRTENIIIIGHSMGGVLGNRLHTKGWNVDLAIYIAAPFHGANLINQLESILPIRIWNWMNKKPYNYLKKKTEGFEPPHLYHTITLGWGWSDFDGCVYASEAKFNEDNNTHFMWKDHRAPFYSIRLWDHIEKLIKNIILPKN